jgi:TetR/AcrR family transcriptional regulator, mexJK operon transcriptional repressor
LRSQSDLPEKSALQKERILNAASDVFLATGFEKTSTAEIARLAKVSKRELYLHFSDKRSLLAAVVKDLQSDIGGRMDSLWASTQPMEDVLLNSAKIIQGFILSERFGKLIRIVAAEAYHSPKIAAQFFEMGPSSGRGATAQYLKQQMKLGNLRKADPMKAADDFLDLVVGAQLLPAVILGQMDPTTPKPSDIRHAVEVFLMIYNPDAPPRNVKPRLRLTR